MTKIDFDDFISDLTAYYGVEQTISPDRANQWFNFVSIIDVLYLPDIKDYIFKNFDFLPRNLPKAMYKAYHGLSEQRQHERRENFVPTPCKDCGGTGILFPYLLNAETLRYAKVTMACGSCANWKQHWDCFDPTTGKTIKHANMQIKILRKTKADIEAMEYFAGFDSDYRTIAKIRELNQAMIENNQRR